MCNSTPRLDQSDSCNAPNLGLRRWRVFLEVAVLFHLWRAVQLSRIVVNLCCSPWWLIRLVGCRDWYRCYTSHVWYSSRAIRVVLILSALIRVIAYGWLPNHIILCHFSGLLLLGSCCGCLCFGCGSLFSLHLCNKFVYLRVVLRTRGSRS